MRVMCGEMCKREKNNNLINHLFVEIVGELIFVYKVVRCAFQLDVFSFGILTLKYIDNL